MSDVKMRFESEDNISSSVDRINESLGNMQTESKKTSQATQGLNSTTKSLVTAFTAYISVTRALAFAKQGLTNATEGLTSAMKMEQMARLNATAFGTLADEMHRLAGEMQHTSTYSVQMINEAQAMIMSYGELGRDTMPRVVRLAGDMGTLFGGITTASQKLGRALQEPSNAFTVLRREIGTVDKSIQDHVKQLTEAGRVQEAQAVILDVLEKRYAGVNAAIRGTPAGELEYQRKMYAEIQQELGEKLLPAMIEFQKVLNTLAQFMVDHGREIALGSLVAGAPLAIAAIKSLIVAVKAKTAAIAASTAVMMANPLFLAAAAVAGGIIAVSTAMKVLNKDVGDSADDFRKTADGAIDLNASLEELRGQLDSLQQKEQLGILTEVEKINLEFAKEFDLIQKSRDAALKQRDALKEVRDIFSELKDVYNISPDIDQSSIKKAKSEIERLRLRFIDAIEVIPGFAEEFEQANKSIHALFDDFTKASDDFFDTSEFGHSLDKALTRTQKDLNRIAKLFPEAIQGALFPEDLIPGKRIAEKLIISITEALSTADIGGDITAESLINVEAAQGELDKLESLFEEHKQKRIEEAKKATQEEQRIAFEASQSELDAFRDRMDAQIQARESLSRQIEIAQMNDFDGAIARLDDEKAARIASIEDQLEAEIASMDLMRVHRDEAERMITEYKSQHEQYRTEIVEEHLRLRQSALDEYGDKQIAILREVELYAMGSSRRAAESAVDDVRMREAEMLSHFEAGAQERVTIEKWAEDQISGINEEHVKRIEDIKNELSRINLSTSERDRLNAIEQLNRELDEKRSILGEEADMEAELEEYKQARLLEIQERYNEEKKDGIRDLYNTWEQSVQATVSAVASIQSALRQSEMAGKELEAQRDKELVRSTVRGRRAQAEALKKIDDDLQQERQEMMLKEWRSKLIMSVVDTHLGIAKTMANLGLPAAIPFMIAAGIAGTASTIAIAANKPKFKDGGFVPGNSYRGDNVDVSVNSGEAILNASQQREFMNIANGRSNVTNNNRGIHDNDLSTHLVVQGNATQDTVDQLDRTLGNHRQQMLEMLYEAADAGEIDKTRLSHAFA